MVVSQMQALAYYAAQSGQFAFYAGTNECLTYRVVVPLPPLIFSLML